ncbi:MAG: hypothetical protein Q4C19_04525 [Clostridiaceae bacterium]|nr:hypothetical protein [Clostridiaceae bacterium]
MPQIKPQKIKIKFENEIQEPLNMLFKDAANIYFNRLKADNKLEILIHQKTDYKNHLKEYFGDATAKEVGSRAFDYLYVKYLDYISNEYKNVN